MELARNRNDLDAQTQIVTRMETDFPQSQWLAEALFSSGNMYLLKKEYARAAEYYATWETISRRIKTDRRLIGGLAG